MATGAAPPFCRSRTRGWPSPAGSAAPAATRTIGPTTRAPPATRLLACRPTGRSGIACSSSPTLAPSIPSPVRRSTRILHDHPDEVGQGAVDRDPREAGQDARREGGETAGVRGGGPTSLAAEQDGRKSACHTAGSDRHAGRRRARSGPTLGRAPVRFRQISIADTYAWTCARGGAD